MVSGAHSKKKKYKSVNRCELFPANLIFTSQRGGGRRGLEQRKGWEKSWHRIRTLDLPHLFPDNRARSAGTVVLAPMSNWE